jgi:hypothetical protein
VTEDVRRAGGRAGFGLPVSGFRFPVSGFRFPASGFGLRASASGLRLPDSASGLLHRKIFWWVGAHGDGFCFGPEKVTSCLTPVGGIPPPPRIFGIIELERNPPQKPHGKELRG